MIINLFPKCLKPYVSLDDVFGRTKRNMSSLAGNLLTTVPASVKRCLGHIKAIIDERKQSMEEHGVNYPDKPVSVQCPSHQTRMLICS
jgi:cytochrome P450